MLTDFASTFAYVASVPARSARRVVVRWRTAAEPDTRGFNVCREQNGSRLLANRRAIAGNGSVDGGARYSFLDRHAPRSTRRYWLQEVRRDGMRVWHGSVTVSR